ncbi:MAG: hypothetical protein CVU44_05170 [Chloroflexi bacterium HGW-Chloroflexi-6]|nr:MAG: hypothetical protein CVU44_05170 [Chloroflexi bacterium HGW-Chloroflexi-6]
MKKKEEAQHQVYGNYVDKYNSKNFIEKYLVENFIQSFKKNINSLLNESIASICEVGCAEGELLKTVYSIFPKSTIFATDISEEEVKKAKINCAAFPVDFSVQNAESLKEYKDSSFEIVICCEVLEHLSDPIKGLEELCRISNKYIIVSVPNEPIWRMLNVARGKYIRSFGNTPGHINHWGVIQFPKFLMTASDYSIIKKDYPFPWQMVLLKKREP